MQGEARILRFSYLYVCTAQMEDMKYCSAFSYDKHFDISISSGVIDVCTSAGDNSCKLSLQVTCQACADLVHMILHAWYLFY